MEPSLYFMLQTNAVANKLEKPTSYSSVYVNSGTLWVFYDDTAGLVSPVHRQMQTHHPDQLLSNNMIIANNQITLYSIEQEEVVLRCTSQELIQISETESQLLLSIPPADRYHILKETTQVQEGCRIVQRWNDQFRVAHRSASVSDIYVYVLGQNGLPEKAAGLVQYVGCLPSCNGTWFGVKLAPRYHGLGATDGFFRGKQFFQCSPDSAVFVAVDRICLSSSEFEGSCDVVQHMSWPGPSTMDHNGVGPPPLKGALWEMGEEDDLQRPPLEIGERVVWISDYGHEPGTVKWIGILPDSKVREYTIGVEFDRPIGTGTGKYNNDQLFRTAQNHASLIPVLGLMKAEEFYGSREAVPPSPFITGLSMTRRIGTNAKNRVTSTCEYGSRLKTPSPHFPMMAINSENKDVKSISDIDQVSDTLCQSDEELGQSHLKQYSKTIPRSTKSTTTSSSDSTSLLTMSSRLSDQASRLPPPPPPPLPVTHEKMSQDNEKSIYDKEPEHYYENVEKDATGRLLNRDTTAFRTIDCIGGGEGERITNARSNSGEDMRGDHSMEENPSVAIYRSSRSVDNIFSDENVIQRKEEEFTMQLPYRTGRSVFYERLEKVSSSVTNGKQNEIKQTNTESLQQSINCEKREEQPLTFVSPIGSPSHHHHHHHHHHLPSSSFDDNNQRCTTTKMMAPQQQRNSSCHSVYNSYDNNNQKDGLLQDRSSKPVRSGVELNSLPIRLDHHWKGNDGSVQGGNGWQCLALDDGVIPRPVSTKELEIDLEIGSVVEVEISGNVRYGVIRWIGILRDRSKPIAGIELEEELNEATDGRLGKTHLFECPPKKGFFVLLSCVRKDGRFEESSKFLNRNASQMFGSMECIDIVGTLPSLSLSSLTSNYVGMNRGIQGHHNSCYMDATLFSMFAFTMVFDSILYRPKQPGDIVQYDEIQLSLREGIVNPLRSNFFVRADKVLRLRTLLDKSSTVQGLIGEEKDPDEFLNSLLQQTLKADPFLHLSSGLESQESFLFQLFMDKDEKVLLPTTQQLLELSFLQSNIKLSEIPSCLILQMPRFGKDYKMFRRIVPSLYLDVTNILQFGIRECTICASLATNECKDCYWQFGESLDKIAFCDNCLDKSHKNPKRSRHKPQKIETNEAFVHFNREQKLTVVGGLDMEGTHEKLELFAVVCIQTSHYVSFVKCGPGPDAPWVFFDSMADRKGEEHGYNIPRVELCSFLPHLLQDETYSTIYKYRDEKDLPDHMRRLLCDGYMCMYQANSLLQYR